MRRIVQEVLENEVSEFTGRDYYKHAEEAQGHRNGYEHSTLRTGEGHLDILRPQVRNTPVPFESQTWPHLKKNTHQLEHMAVECFEGDFEACIQHLRCPAKHRRHITTTNLVERSFGEENRRSKVIPRFFTEKSGLKLIYAVLIRVAKRWNALKFTFDEQAQILAL